ncbi:hypothetical protein OSSY52_01410 [Tepiditoga spiralis]|uniref:Uncharacterized protein n=1 Tax=Tepiditoga spiralis TaxID=2108365 RepID=A0A7G1G1F6_9BACT|nr:hypothetical protein [Tepiditoga spiralis]BBE30000.1 hypothetical protein OSSY52_01410 [Tepiditoga spiralis]
MKKFFYVLFFGALWGLTEATLGYGLHFISVFIPGIAGFVMFAFAFLFMNMAYKKTKNLFTVIEVSMVAASIKLLDLALPIHPIKAINPAISILFEGLAVFTFLYLFKNKKSFTSIFTMSMSWRVAFVLLSFIEIPLNAPNFVISKNLIEIMNFLIIDSLINSIIIYAFMKKIKLPEFKRIKNMKITPALSLVILSVAMLAELNLR